VNRNIDRSTAKTRTRSKSNVENNITTSKTVMAANKKAASRRASIMLKAVVQKTLAAVDAADFKCSPKRKKTRRMLDEVENRRKSSNENICNISNSNDENNISKVVKSAKKKERPRRKRGNMRELFGLK
jgi:hypothetical protein